MKGGGELRWKQRRVFKDGSTWGPLYKLGEENCEESGTEGGRRRGGC